MRPILVSGRLLSAPDYPEVRDALDVRWAPFLEQAGLFPLVVPSRAPLAPYLAMGDVAGLLLTGGNDLAVVAADELSQERDRRELEILSATEARMPVVGVCRGLQLLAWRAGAALEAVEGHVATEHALSVDPDSRYLADYQGQCTNSFHGFGIGATGDRFRPVAWSGDGVVEAIEHVALPIVGIMWHPERREPSDARDVALFRRLFGNGADR